MSSAPYRLHISITALMWICLLAVMALSGCTTSPQGPPSADTYEVTKTNTTSVTVVPVVVDVLGATNAPLHVPVSFGVEGATSIPISIAVSLYPTSAVGVVWPPPMPLTPGTTPCPCPGSPPPTVVNNNTIYPAMVASNCVTEALLKDLVEKLKQQDAKWLAPSLKLSLFILISFTIVSVTVGRYLLILRDSVTTKTNEYKVLHERIIAQLKDKSSERDLSRLEGYVHSLYGESVSRVRKYIILVKVEVTLVVVGSVSVVIQSGVDPANSWRVMVAFMIAASVVAIASCAAIVSADKDR